MTANIIQALANAEVKRYNLALEKLKDRELAENQRHNQFTERESVRHNQAQEYETRRSNLMSENIRRESNTIDYRNALTNARNAATNERNILINARNAETNRISALSGIQSNITSAMINAAGVSMRSKELEEQRRHNKAVEEETYRNNVVINDIKSREADISKRRAETERWAAERRYEVDQQYIQQGWARNIGDVVINGSRIMATPQ